MHNDFRSGDDQTVWFFTTDGEALKSHGATLNEAIHNVRDRLSDFERLAFYDVNEENAYFFENGEWERYAWM